MILLFFVGMMLSVLMLLIGLIKPSVVLHWGRKRTRKQAALLYGITAILFLIGVIAVTLEAPSPTAAYITSSPSPNSNPATPSAVPIPLPKAGGEQKKDVVRFEMTAYSPPAYYEGEVNEQREPHGDGKIMWPLTVYDEKTQSQVNRTFPIYEGEFQNGSYHGKGTLYNKEHAIEFSGQFDHGNPVPYPYDNEFYYEDGSIRFHGDPAKQKAASSMRVFHPGGKLYYEGGWKNAAMNGAGTVYYWNGVKHEEGIYKNGLINGDGKRYSDNGNLQEEGEFKEGKLEGKGKLYHDNGKLKMEGAFKAGRLEGKAKLYDDNGVLRADGTFTYDNQSNQIRLTGAAKTYYENGQLQFTGKFKNGELNGEGTEYYDNGKPKYRGQFHDGKYDGKGVLYNDAGQEL